MNVKTNTPGAGPLLRTWRQRRHLSQLDLSNRAAVSTRHLSFVETGRSKPSRELLLHLAEELDVPLRERNTLLLAGGFAPVYDETPLEAEDMQPVRQALDHVLRGHEPYPAVVVNRGWELMAANRALPVLVEHVDPELLEPPVNVLRVALHPRGVAARVVNIDEYRNHLLTRLRRQVDRTADPDLKALLDEVEGYARPHGRDEQQARVPIAQDVVVPIVLRTDDEDLSFFSTISTFGTAIDITLDDLAIEAFFPADDHTAETLRARFG